LGSAAAGVLAAGADEAGAEAAGIPADGEAMGFDDAGEALPHRKEEMTNSPPATTKTARHAAAPSAHRPHGETVFRQSLWATRDGSAAPMA